MQTTVDARDESNMEAEYLKEAADMWAKTDKIKQHLVDNSVIIKKIFEYFQIHIFCN